MLPDQKNTINSDTDDSAPNATTRPIFAFLKKYKRIIAALILMVSTLLSVYIILPTININETKLVNLDTPVRIKPGQVIKLKNFRASVKILYFSNETCPIGETCFGSTPTVAYQLTIDGQKYATGSVTKAMGTKYQVDTISSDYETYANIKIIKAN